MRRPVTLVLCCLLALISRNASAQHLGGSVQQAVDLYQDLEYRAAADLLKKMLRSKKLSTSERARGYQYLGLCYVVLRETQPAKKAFRQLLKILPNFRLSKTENPRARDLLEEVRESLPRAKQKLATQLPKILVTPWPVPAKPDASVDITITLPKAIARHKTVVYYRTRGKKLYSTVVAKAGRGARHVATIAGAFVLAPAVEYYAVVVSDQGRVVAQEGSKTDPLSIAVNARREDAATPIYKKWWLWTTVGVVAAGAFGYWKFSQVSNDAIVDINIVVNDG